MISKSYFRIYVLGIFLSLLFSCHILAEDLLSGRVFKGNKWDESTGIYNVTVKLYGSANPGELGTQIGSTTTDGTGWYQLLAPAGYEYYHIVETDPSGYYSVGVSSVDGDEIDYNHIRYSIVTKPLADQTLTGNKFWDKQNAPDMEVSWNSVMINDGSTTPSSSNGTDFGSVNVSSGSVSKTYTIQNTGNLTLTLSGATISGSGDFTVTSQPGSSVTPGATTTFTVRFDPSASGTRSATVSIPNNSAKNPYNFAIRGTGIEIQQDEYDFGDAGDQHGNYPNYLAQNGARHKIVPGFCLGTLIDAEPDAQVSVDENFCMGDDNQNLDDEDGVKLIHPWHKGQECSLEVTATIPAGLTGYLDVWFDYNGDENWDSSEKVFNSVNLTNGVNTLSFIHPMSGTGSTARFRLSSTGGLDPIGPADDGEVEDHCGITTYTMDYGDAPTPYPTLRADNGARHTASGNYCLGSSADPDSIGFPDQDALGDDNDNSDDEDGVYLPTLIRGQPAQVSMEVHSYSIFDTLTFVQAWIDWNNDKVWQHPGEQVYCDILPDGMNTITIQVPASTDTGITYARFRSSKNGNLTPEGYAGYENYGEVEDYMVIIDEQPGQYEYDFGDAPEDAGRGYFYPVTLANNGARHRIARNGPYLGSNYFKNHIPDAEKDGQPDLDAKGDDKTDYCDECGCVGGYLIRDFPHDIDVVVGSGGIVDIWVDADRDGIWQHPAERIFSGYLPTGSNKVQVTLPGSAVLGWTYIRLRISTAGGLTPEGPAPDGEVVDDKIKIYEADFGDAPDSYGTRLPHYNYRIIDKDLVMLGNSVDGEPDGQPGPLADGDDTNGISDEDGIQFLTPLVPGQTALVEITCTTKPKTPCEVDGYLDFHGDGHFDMYDHLFSFGHFTPNTQTVYIKSFMVPDTPMEGKLTVDGPTYSRFRIRGGAWDWGEIEDYRVIIGESTMRDYGDAPASYGDAWHTPGAVWLGDQTDIPDTETGTQNDPHALGDDNDGNNDENGFSIPGGVLVKHNLNQASILQEFTFAPVNGLSDITICMWVDYDQDGNFMDSGDFIGAFGASIQNPTQLKTESSIYKWNIPSHAKTGKTIMRIRAYNQSVFTPSPTGDGGVGEVNDHEVEISEEGETLSPGGIIHGYKWNDLNGNGQWDNLGTIEPPLENWTIWLDTNQDGKADITTQTDSQGLFEFTGLQDGIYIVGEETRTGWTQTQPSGSGTYTETVEYDKPYSIGILFGNQETEPDTGIGAIKWSQPPLFDLMTDDTTSYFGWPESSNFSDSYLADDWFCHDPHPVTSIRWWGSYAEWDSLFPPPEAPQYFRIGIWRDIPEDSAIAFSHPGELVQEWFVPRYELHETIDKIHYDPEHMQKPATCFRYTYYIPQIDWFYQEGDSTVYWLNIGTHYDNIPGKRLWCWLTREHYFNDDAVRLWQPLELYPGAIFEGGEPVTDLADLSFELGTDEYESNYDFGDAPDIGYGTTLARNGAHHLFNNSIYLGKSIDTEPDGQPHAEALGDDHDGSPDEDGITFLNTLIPGEMAGIQVTASTAGFLNAWVDFNGDGTWNHPEEQVINDLEFAAGTHMMEFSVPEDALNGYTFARFRFSTWSDVWVRGFAGDGEVEDYQILVGTSDVNQRSDNIPDQYRLYQNYPNPFNPKTTIRFEIPFTGKQMVKVELHIYNVQGQDIRTLIDDVRPPGAYQIKWDGLNNAGKLVATGIYFCRIRTEKFTSIRKMILIN